MKLINLLLIFTFYSCSTIPKGAGIMKEQIEIDQKEISIKPEKINPTTSGKRVQVVRAYPQVNDSNILTLEAIYYVPYPEKKINWENDHEF